MRFAANGSVKGKTIAKEGPKVKQTSVMSCTRTRAQPATTKKRMRRAAQLLRKQNNNSNKKKGKKMVTMTKHEMRL